MIEPGAQSSCNPKRDLLPNFPAEVRSTTHTFSKGRKMLGTTFLYFPSSAPFPSCLNNVLISKFRRRFFIIIAAEGDDPPPPLSSLLLLRPPKAKSRSEKNQKPFRPPSLPPYLPSSSSSLSIRKAPPRSLPSPKAGEA